MHEHLEPVCDAHRRALAKTAVERGLQVKRYVKTAFRPVRGWDRILAKAGLLEPLGKRDSTGGYGCMTCMGKIRAAPEVVTKGFRRVKFVAAAVLSGNRNFEGRIHFSNAGHYLPRRAGVA